MRSMWRREEFILGFSHIIKSPDPRKRVYRLGIKVLTSGSTREQRVSRRGIQQAPPVDSWIDIYPVKKLRELPLQTLSPRSLRLAG